MSDIVPGTLYDWRQWRNKPGVLPKQGAGYHVEAGQLVWRPLDGSGARAMAVLVGGRQVELTDEALVQNTMARLDVSYFERTPGMTPQVKQARIPLAQVVERLAENLEIVDATPVATS